MVVVKGSEVASLFRPSAHRLHVKSIPSTGPPSWTSPDCSGAGSTPLFSGRRRLVSIFGTKRQHSSNHVTGRWHTRWVSARSGKVATRSPDFTLTSRLQQPSSRPLFGNITRLSQQCEPSNSAFAHTPTSTWPSVTFTNVARASSEVSVLRKPPGPKLTCSRQLQERTPRKPARQSRWFCRWGLREQLESLQCL